MFTRPKPDEDWNEVVRRWMNKTKTMLESQEACSKMWDAILVMSQHVQEDPKDPVRQRSMRALEAFLTVFSKLEELEIPREIIGHFAGTNASEVHCCIDEGEPYRVILWDPRYVACAIMQRNSWWRPEKRNPRTRIVRIVWNSLLNRDVKAARDKYFDMLDKGCGAYIPLDGDRWTKTNVFPEDAEELAFAVPVEEEELFWEFDPLLYKGVSLFSIWSAMKLIKTELDEMDVRAPKYAKLVGDGCS